jgi:hypothetical protein
MSSPLRDVNLKNMCCLQETNSTAMFHSKSTLRFSGCLRGTKDGVESFLVACMLGKRVDEAKLAEFSDQIQKVVQAGNLDDPVDLAALVLHADS